ncbi:unnamed protein product [Leuciscus chuanchicus]
MDDTEASDFSDDERIHRELLESPVNLHFYKNDKGVHTEIFFLKSNRKCLKRIRDAMLLHNWQEAALYYNSYIQALEARNSIKVHPTASEITWRIGTEILRHLPNATADDFNAVYEQLKNNGVKNFPKICLEHCFHLLLNGQMEEAKRQLSIGESWRYGNFSIAQGDTKKLIRAYSGFLDYLNWCEKKSSTAGTDEASHNHEMHSYFRYASVALKDIISQPGVWDPFVLSYINMLEFYNDEDGALQILKNYAYNKEFPINPNAHVYLYQFLKRHNAPDDRLIGSLRILHSLVPSHELMLDLCSLLLGTTGAPTLEPPPMGPGQAQTKGATWGRPPVGSPPAGGTVRERCIVAPTTRSLDRETSFRDAERHLTADGYRQAKRTAARVVVEPKIGPGRSLVRPWRRTTGWPQRFWQTVQRPRRGKQCPTNTVYSGGGQLLTSTGDIVGRWKKYFEDLLNPTNTSYIEEAEDKSSEVDSSITQI